ncbi:serine hydrolase domain-containing protein [Kordiimonas aquimaris]|uniref:serine hydrolase domain-containing protein n=1 Tax=Kordiimonas aquimaris TaxID=707591 RepID=UPI0021D2755B|nr:serine hydrolase domain-containing protein [Kordiimonas aquimaris]
MFTCVNAASHMMRACVVICLTYTPSYADDTDVVRELDAFITQETERDAFSGTVLLAKGDEVIYSTARGLASKRFGVPNNLQTKFGLGSLNKTFTAFSVMQLVESGQIKLTDTLDQFLDETWLAHNARGQIQIQHLLTHASGLGSYFTDAFFASSKNNFRTLADFKPLVVNDTPEFPPGTSYRYSNNGMFLLGAVIEAVTGSSYFDYIEAHIIQPAGMANTGCFEMDEPVPNLAIGYTPAPENKSGWRTNIIIKPVKGGPAGGCYSTVEDLHRFARALTSFQFLNQLNTQMLYTPKPAFHSEPYGFGFKVAGTEHNRIVGHTGGFVGISAFMDIYLDKGYVAVALANYGGATRPVAAKIRELLE